MVGWVIDLSSALGLTTIAKGIEHSDQLARPGDLACDGAQGYPYAKPMPSRCQGPEVGLIVQFRWRDQRECFQQVFRIHGVTDC